MRVRVRSSGWETYDYLFVSRPISMSSPSRERPHSSIDASHAPTLPHAWTPTHDVQFYESEDVLASSIARFLLQGVRVGQPMVVIATSAHRKAFKKKMRAMGIDLDE